MKRLAYVLLAAFALASMPAQARVLDEMSATEKQAVDQGRAALREQTVPGSSWPKVTVFKRIEATPEEVAAVFADAELHRTYFPSISKSKISKRHGPRSFEVDYTLDLPLFMKENYTTLDTLGSYDNGASYRVEWKKVRADSTQHIEGNMRVEKYGTGTIIAYYNFIIPGGLFADLAKGEGVKQVVKTVEALDKQVEGERARNQPLLQKQVKALHDALGN